MMILLLLCLLLGMRAEAANVKYENATSSFILESPRFQESKDWSIGTNITCSFQHCYFRIQFTDFDLPPGSHIYIIEGGRALLRVETLACCSSSLPVLTSRSGQVRVQAVIPLVKGFPSYSGFRAIFFETKRNNSSNHRTWLAHYNTTGCPKYKQSEVGFLEMKASKFGPASCVFVLKKLKICPTRITLLDMAGDVRWRVFHGPYSQGRLLTDHMVRRQNLTAEFGMYIQLRNLNLSRPWSFKIFYSDRICESVSKFDVNPNRPFVATRNKGGDSSLYVAYTLVPLLILIVMGCLYYRLTVGARDMFMRRGGRTRQVVEPPPYNIALTHPKPEIDLQSALPSYEASVADRAPPYTETQFTGFPAEGTTASQSVPDTAPPSYVYSIATSPQSLTSPLPDVTGTPASQSGSEGQADDARISCETEETATTNSHLTQDAHRPY